ncbi:MAG TPA: hypothetical protein PK079_07055 [Leptospiraceae bacterium]|nr:hypothetical protein [Leptospiraceae bacterium]HMW05966.1 hypothetical protein [Leptospiraceae bacterium]HMX32102.1 hypothetical protein [Leptospiraceae bacterium]HMY32320.1 hypothetical protein [Leptospiraceae bacterium]HMZ62478.1 hypothetical protein [Leptospiraceae bacterium]
MNALLENTIKELGFPSLEEFAKHQAIAILTQKILTYQKEIEKYISKYGMNYSEFSERHSEISHIDMLEKEDDQMDWEIALHSLHSLQKKVNSLKEDGDIPMNERDYRKRIEDYILNVR